MLSLSLATCQLYKQWWSTQYSHAPFNIIHPQVFFVNTALPLAYHADTVCMPWWFRLAMQMYATAPGDVHDMRLMVALTPLKAQECWGLQWNAIMAWLNMKSSGYAMQPPLSCNG